MRSRGYSLLAAAAALVLVPPAMAGMITIQPSSQDAYVQKDKPNRIAGAGPTHRRISVEASPANKVRRGLVQFDLSAIPTGSTVNSAVLGLFEGNNPNSPVTHGVHRTLTPWLQSAVKWTNQPTAAVSPTATALVPADTLREFRDFTVTADVQNFVNLCTDNHGWLVKDQNEGGNQEVNYVAKEEDDPQEVPGRPRLVVDFTPPTCVTDADCADANFCTTNEHCIAGLCVVDPVICNDNNPCTDDICDCAQGCIFSPICNDGFSCTLDTCDPQTLACTNTPIAGACNTACSTGTCVADPDNGNIDPDTGCQVSTINPQGTPCNDGDLCTQNDQCDNAGHCASGTQVTCTALGQCYVAGTCTPQTGMCSNPPKGSGTACSDGSLCTQTDACDGGGTCVGANPVVCTAQGQCYDVGTCDPQTGTCSNPPKGSGTGCNDGSLCTQTDACDGGGTCVGSNDVICTALDDCHLTGTCNPGTGLCSNPPAGDGTTCDDGNVCTLGDTCTGGVCGGDPMTCGDGIVQTACGEECDASGDPTCTPQCQLVCGPTPEPGCRAPALAGKAFVKLNDKPDDKRDKLLWKWVKGSATTEGDFGDPLTATYYILCVWDESADPQPRLLAVVPPDRLCGKKPCWKRARKSLKYRNKALDPDGVQTVVLKFGPDQKAKILVKGKGPMLAMPPLPLTPKVTVQLHNDAGVCWEAQYSTPKKNETQQFKGRAD
jgi:Dictyostelium (slime mold) repeat